MIKFIDKIDYFYVEDDVEGTIKIFPKGSLIAKADEGSDSITLFPSRGVSGPRVSCLYTEVSEPQSTSAIDLIEKLEPYIN